MEGRQVLAAQQTAEQQAAAAKKGGFSNNGLGNQVHKPVPIPALAIEPAGGQRRQQEQARPVRSGSCNARSYASSTGAL